MHNSVAAARSATRTLFCRRLYAANECAEDLSIYLRRNRVDVNSLPCEKYLGVFRAMDARGLDLHLLESRGRQLAFVIILIQCAGNAAYPGENVFPNFRKDLAPGDHIGNGESAAWLQNSIGLAQNFVFIRGKIDNAVGDDDVD